MSNLFNSISVRKPKYNRFNLSHSVKQTMKPGKITPFLCEPTIPGDVWKCNTESLIRFAPFLAPVMHKINLTSHYFFVPSRLLWSHFKDWVTGKNNPRTGKPYLYPRLVVTQAFLDGNPGLFKPGGLLDYLGYPVTQLKAGSVIDPLPIVAYRLIYDEYYIDQNLQTDNWTPLSTQMRDLLDMISEGNTPYFTPEANSDELTYTDEDGVVWDVEDGYGVSEFEYGGMNLMNKAWKKDYFTSALPWAQRGDEVMLPLGGNADIDWGDEIGINNGITHAVGMDSMGEFGYNRVSDIYLTQRTVSGSSTRVASLNSNALNYDGDENNTQLRFGGLINPNGSETLNNFTEKSILLNKNNLGELIRGVDLSKVSSATINELRRAIKAQEFLELSARGGQRYIEQIYAYFGVRSSDARLQRPEFLGGGKSPIVISDVLQTSQTTETSPQASPAGHGVGVQKTHGFKYFCEEHGYVIGLMSIMPTPGYMQGMPRKFQKFDRLDYYWPQFAHLGEQEIKESEIFYQADAVKDNATFGYAPRYAEYKFITDRVSGDFRTSLDFWHMARKFATPPQLNEDFITNVESAFNRPFALKDTGYDLIWCNIFNKIACKRLMPKYGTPLF